MRKEKEVEEWGSSRKFHENLKNEGIVILKIKIFWDK